MLLAGSGFVKSEGKVPEAERDSGWLAKWVGQDAQVLWYSYLVGENWASLPLDSRATRIFENVMYVL